MLDDAMLLKYVRDSLSKDESLTVETALRSSAEMRSRLQRLLDAHCVDELGPGSVWRESRLSCPSREEWGSFLLGILDLQSSDYCRFHLEVVECPYCRANVEDLKESNRTTLAESQIRQERVFRSSAGKIGFAIGSDSSSLD